MTITNNFFNRLEGTWQNKLGGQWQDHMGWIFISQPKLNVLGKGVNVPGKNNFQMRFDQMRETIEFKKIPELARNVGITGEAGFWQAMAYEVSIKTPNGPGIHHGIHHEMGHFLLNVLETGETPVLENGETDNQPRGDVIRQATIPRANAMMTTGELKPGTIANAIDDAIAKQEPPFYNAKPQANEDALQAQIDNDFATKQQQVTQLDGPNLERPLDWLKTILADNPIGQDWVFEFRHDKGSSQMASGQRVVNPVSIGNLLSDFWIAKRNVNGETIEILQYAQKVNLIFHGFEWPHVAVNTLIKQPQ